MVNTLTLVVMCVCASGCALQLEKQRAHAEIEAELEEKKRLEEEAEQARFDALPEEEKQRILAERAAEREKEEAARQALLAENKAKRDAIAAKEEARLAAKRAESEKERAEAMVRDTHSFERHPLPRTNARTRARSRHVRVRSLLLCSACCRSIDRPVGRSCRDALLLLQAAQQAQAQSKLAANKRYTGTVLKFDKAKRFGFIRDDVRVCVA